MKKILALVLAALMCISLVACGGNAPETTDETTEPAEVEKVKGISVITSMGGDDWMRGTYEATFKAWEEKEGIQVYDGSATANETWKATILNDYEIGSEPDVVYFFTGADSDPIVKKNGFVTIDEIRADYPDFASNMNDDLLPVACDGKKYSIPIVGYWEGMFVNEDVCEAAGVEVPGKDTTWDEFIEICQKIKDAGYTPIAISFSGAEGVHYLIEHTIMNHGGIANHVVAPKTASDDAAKNWIAGMEDIIDLYNKGFFPENVATNSHEDAKTMLQEGKAAFWCSGSWNDALDDGIDGNFTVTYVPGSANRKATDIIAGLSMGFYISRSAYEDPAKRDAVVSFVEAMTATDVVLAYAGPNRSTSLKADELKGASTDGLTAVQIDAIDFCAGATGTTGAAQDNFDATARGVFFGDAAAIAAGDMTAADAMAEAIAAIQ